MTKLLNKKLPFFKTLYGKLALVLFLIVLFSGTLFLVLVRTAAERYHQEITQKLNLKLAGNIAKDALLLEDNKINRPALENIFHMLMVINPNIEVYLLDKTGKILAYSAAKEKIKRDAVNLEPLRHLIEGDQETLQYPFYGDDPRHPDRQKVFSAAPISTKNLNEGYLYVILGGEAFDNIVAMLKGSYTMRTSLFGLIASLSIALIAGLLIFSLFTKRLKQLTSVIQNYTRSHFKQDANTRYAAASAQNDRDEIDQLGKHFNLMADHIDEQWTDLKKSDETRREMVANVSHDLRTPLASLNGYLETLLIKKEALSEAEREEYLETALRHSKRLGVLIEELFELAKLDSYKKLMAPSEFSMGELIQDVIQKLKLAAEKKGIQLSADFGQKLPFVVGDIGMIQRVLENLLENALRHTPTGGTIRLLLSEERSGPLEDRIIVKVEDSGTGIAPDDLPHIFDRFYRQQKSRQGGGYHAGLGLAIVKRILELHGGKVTAESHNKQGSVFTFDLPRTKVSGFK